ncbi:hypothetical protein D9M69_662300 [compost metagenome]
MVQQWARPRKAAGARDYPGEAAIQLRFGRPLSARAAEMASELKRCEKESSVHSASRPEMWMAAWGRPL